MGNIEVRNPLFSKKHKRSEARLLIIDDNQIRFNQICDQLKENDFNVVATLLDDVKNFEKQLNFKWDVVIFGRAYDLKFDQAIALIRSSTQPDLPLLLLNPDDYEYDQYTSYIHKGLYDVLNIDHPERFYYGLIRTIAFSRLQQQQENLMDELETAQTQAQSLVEDSNKALAIIQEGIHVQANPEYLELFGFKSEDEIIGLPLLDLLQPQNIAELKTRIKKASQGQLDAGAFSLESLNTNLANKNPLTVEFIKATEEDAIQITIDMESTAAKTNSVETAAQNPHVFQQINRTLQKQPAAKNALVSFSLANCPEQIFQSDWLTSKTYFQNIRVFLKEQTKVNLFKVDTSVYIGLFQADTQAILDSKLASLSTLTKPQLIDVNGSSYPLSLRMGFSLLNSTIKDELDFENYIAQAFSTKLPIPCEKTTIDFCLDTEFAPNIDIPITQLESPTIAITPINVQSTEPVFIAPQLDNTLGRLTECLNKGEIHLKYQQLYDKEDTNLYTYEVTSSFIDDKTWKNCCDILELANDPELSIKLDRWILVESCNQLHNFITQYPTAKLIINLNKHILLQDKSFPEFVAKLITIIGSSAEYPLILQFSEEDIHQQIDEAQKKITQLRAHGAQISMRNFGRSMYSETLLKQIDIDCLALHTDLTQMLSDEATAQELNEKLLAFQEIRPSLMLLRELNDMNLFANAWNVEARFIQGDYFQKKLDQLIDVQDL